MGSRKTEIIGVEPVITDKSSHGLVVSVLIRRYLQLLQIPQSKLNTNQARQKKTAREDLDNHPRALVMPDGTTSLGEKDTDPERVIATGLARQLLEETDLDPDVLKGCPEADKILENNKVVEVFVFGDKEHLYHQFDKADKSLGFEDGDGNRHEDPMGVMMEALGIMGVALEGFNHVDPSRLEYLYLKGDIIVSIITDEYPHLSGVTKEALQEAIKMIPAEKRPRHTDEELEKMVKNFEVSNRDEIDLLELLTALRKAKIGEKNIDLRINVYSPLQNLDNYRWCDLLYLGKLWQIIALASGGEWYDWSKPQNSEHRGKTGATQDMKQRILHTLRLAAAPMIKLLGSPNSNVIALP